MADSRFSTSSKTKVDDAVNMRWSRLSVMAAAIIGGCATPGELRSGVPDYASDVPRPADVVAACIVDKWESGFLQVKMNVRPLRGGGTSLTIIGGFQQPLLLVDVKKVGSESRIELYKQSLGPDPYIADVQDCAK